MVGNTVREYGDRDRESICLQLGLCSFKGRALSGRSRCPRVSISGNHEMVESDISLTTPLLTVYLVAPDLGIFDRRDDMVSILTQSSLSVSYSSYRIRQVTLKISPELPR